MSSLGLSQFPFTPRGARQSEAESKGFKAGHLPGTGEAGAQRPHLPPGLLSALPLWKPQWRPHLQKFPGNILKQVREEGRSPPIPLPHQTPQLPQKESAETKRKSQNSCVLGYSWVRGRQVEVQIPALPRALGNLFNLSELLLSFLI